MREYLNLINLPLLLKCQGGYNFLGSVSSKQKLKQQTSVTALRWTSVTAQFYLESKGKYILEA